MIGRSSIDERSYPVRSPREQRCEILDIDTREVWQDSEPTPKDWYEEAELALPLVKLGIATGYADRAWFRRSPNDVRNGPVRERIIGGRTFFCCALAPAGVDPAKSRKMLIEKYHTVGFDAGREVEFLTNDAGEAFVLVVGSPRALALKDLPDDWSVSQLVLPDDWIVDLPTPTVTYWFSSRGLISYQGPIAIPPRGLLDIES